MGILSFLILFPLAVGITLLCVKNERVRNLLVRISAPIIGIATIVLAVLFLGRDGTFFTINGELISNIIMVIEIALSLVIIVLGIRNRKYLASLFSLAQTVLMLWFEFTGGRKIAVSCELYIDRLNVLMALIIGIIGSAIAVYAVGYMKVFHEHDKDIKDRRQFFFFIFYIFLAAMFGLVFSNNLSWIYFFWEITSLSSFFMIGYTRTKEAVNNSFRALIMNLLGGLAFAIAIVFIGRTMGTLELDQFLRMGKGMTIVALPAALLAFACFTKSAQMPFTSWLTGAMVAPTPCSALLHSSTMVKAGVFLLIKLAPVLSGNMAGLLTMMTGGVTFLFAAFAAISQSNGKKVLAYSTVSNLGLIVACAGIGTYESVWVAMMLIIFHAVAKSLMFLCVGTAEHHVGSRDIEDFDGLFSRMPQLAVCMSVGICGMFLAPFGMLVSKWAAMKAFVDAQQPLLLLVLVFGSAATFFFWTKWLGKITAIVAHRQNIEQDVRKDEWLVIKGLSVLTVLTCLLFPIISNNLVVPQLETVFHQGQVEIISRGNMYIMVFMVLVIVLLPILGFGKSNKKLVHVYMAGENIGNDLEFRGSLGKAVPISLRNWYMTQYFGEHRMLFIGSCINIIMIVLTFAVLFPTMMGGAL